MARKAEEYNADTYELRLVKINQYLSRLKWVMGGTAGLLLFAGSDLITSFEKAILVTFVFVNIILGYISMVGFEDAKTDIEYKISGKPELKTSIVAVDSWPVDHEKEFRISTIIFLILALLVFIFMWINVIYNWVHTATVSCSCF